MMGVFHSDYDGGDFCKGLIFGLIVLVGLPPTLLLQAVNIAAAVSKAIKSFFIFVLSKKN